MWFVKSSNTGLRVRVVSAPETGREGSVDVGTTYRVSSTKQVVIVYSVHGKS